MGEAVRGGGHQGVAPPKHPPTHHHRLPLLWSERTPISEPAPHHDHSTTGQQPAAVDRLIEDRAGQAVGRAALFVPAAGWAAAAAGWISRERVAAASSFYTTESHALAMNPAPHHHTTTTGRQQERSWRRRGLDWALPGLARAAGGQRRLRRREWTDRYS